jgi:hypothetical protein
MNQTNYEQSGTGMSFQEMKAFIRDHFEQFVNRKNLDIADANFTPDFVDHGADGAAGYAARPNGRKTVCGKRAEEISGYESNDCKFRSLPR